MRAIKGKMIVKIDLKEKERYALTSDITITIQKGFNFNLREDRSAKGIVIYSETLPVGCSVLIHHLATEPSYLIENETILTKEEKQQGFKVFSIPNDMAYCYNEGEEWKPCKEFLITQRILKEYKGTLVGIEHSLVKDRLLVIKGSVEDAPKLEGKVCVVTENSAVEVIWHNSENREERLIRTRSREIIAIDHKMTKQVNNGELLVGLNSSTAKKLLHVYA